MNKRLQFALALSAVTAGLLSACGGGGGGGASSLGTSASVTGVAATGAAIAAGTVSLNCAAGAVRTVTTGSDGSFVLDVTLATMPCVGRVDYKDASGAAQKLHTLVSQAGVANITPVTELIVANLTGGTAADAFDQFAIQPPKIKTITAAQIKTAADAVKAFLKTTLGIDVSGLPDDLIGTRFVAANGTVKGDKFDAVLDDLQAKLKGAGAKLSDATAYASQGFPPPGSGGSGSSGGSGPLSAPTPLTTAPLTTQTTSFSGCPSGGAGTATYSCTVPLTGATALTRADADQFVGTYSNGSATNGSTDLYIGQGLTAYYGLSGTAYPAVSACKQTDGSLYVTYDAPGSRRLVFTQTGTAKAAAGSIPTTPATQITNAAQTSCNF